MIPSVIEIFLVYSHLLVHVAKITGRIGIYRAIMVLILGCVPQVRGESDHSVLLIEIPLAHDHFLLEALGRTNSDSIGHNWNILRSSTKIQSIAFDLSRHALIEISYLSPIVFIVLNYWVVRLLFMNHLLANRVMGTQLVI